MTQEIKTDRSLTDLGEFGLIDLIARKVRPSSVVHIGIGDDAAAFHWQPHCLALATTDMLVEGVHFDLSFCDPFRLGRKALAVNLSDIAAMGGRPRSFLLSLAIPNEFSVDFINDFSSGLLEIAEEFGVTLIGGDTCVSRSGLVIGITLYGEQEEQKVTQRGTARPGESIFVTGYLGDSALGLKLLQRGLRQGEVIDRHLDPTPRVHEGLALAEAGLTCSMIDISDGLLSDLGHITGKSAMGARLHLDKIPLSREYSAHFGSESQERYLLALGGGEDYELLFTAPAYRKCEIEMLFRKLGTPVSEIGEITSVPGIRLFSAEGETLQGIAPGYDHFLSRKGNRS
ncbi:MAG: thiamine-phosphate kinase [Deltaproteobacteria bacterium]|nr:thiamine-phosphate kinase [Deltaproteobacteria bacterium]TLN04617.1 MAG: thiamine-phosphate kinase [bacterium]